MTTEEIIGREVRLFNKYCGAINQALWEIKPGHRPDSLASAGYVKCTVCGHTLGLSQGVWQQRHEAKHAAPAAEVRS